MSGGSVRIAHFSDTHVLSLRGARPGRFVNKRLTGAVNLAFNRARHYRVEVFERLLEAVTAFAPDHTICTGDLVNLALPAEFERVADLLSEHFDDDALTVVPGNHDYYARDAVNAGLFERHFGRWQPQRRPSTASAHRLYPVLRGLDGASPIVIVGLSTAIQTPVFMATGEVGRSQLEAAIAYLEAAPDAFRLVMLHHPLTRARDRRFDYVRRLVDAEAVCGAFVRASAPPHLVVHGHNHAFARTKLPTTEIPVVQVGSASRIGGRHVAEFNVYTVRDGTLVDIERHIFDPETRAFVACDSDANPRSTVNPSA